MSGAKEEAMDQSGMEELRELVQFLKENGVAEFDMERPELKVRLKFAGAEPASGGGATELSRLLATLPHNVSSTHDAHGAAHATSAEAAGTMIPTAVAAVADEALHEVRSPLVGTFYESASPGAPAFVNLGDQVEIGQVLCIVEAMKLMNEIESDMAGEVVRRIAASGQPVEYGQPLFSIRPR